MRIVRVADSGGSVHIGQRSPGVEITPIDGHTGIAGLLASRAEELRALLEVTDAHAAADARLLPPIDGPEGGVGLGHAGHQQDPAPWPAHRLPNHRLHKLHARPQLG